MSGGADLFTLVNQINQLQDKVEGSKKTIAHFKEVNTIKFSLYKILTKAPKKEERLNFRKT